MRDVKQSIKDAWLSGDYTGDRRAITRVTVQQGKVQLYDFRGPGGVYATYSSLPFGMTEVPMELPNVFKVDWDRDSQAEIASCRLELWNTAPQPLGTVLYPDLDNPGYFTPSRGLGGYATRWSDRPNEWSGMLQPDNVIKTYQGYGFNPDACPDDDEHLELTGVWMIDSVRYDNSGTISVNCRDIGRVLVNQIAFPPVVPPKHYPLRFTVSPEATGFLPGGESENQRLRRIADDIEGGQRTLNDIRRSVDLIAYGPGKHFEPLPVPFLQDEPYLEYSDLRGRQKLIDRIKQIFSNRGVTITKAPGEGGAPARVEAGAGQYPGIYNDYTDIVKLMCAWGGFFWPSAGSSTETAQQRLQRLVADVYLRKRTLDDIRRSADFIAYGNTTTHYEPLPVPLARDAPFLVTPAMASQRVQQIFANRGIPLAFEDDSPGAQIVKCDGSFQTFDYGPGPYGLPKALDPVLGTNAGRVWGDFEETGTYGVSDLGVGIWDKKSLLDCIVYVREIIGFLFYIDETGAAVWRAPNIYKLGNNVATLTQQPRRTQEFVTLDENLTLMDLSVTLDSRNVRERVFVASSDGRSIAVAAGHNANPIGLRRVSGWTDQNFRAQTPEGQAAADAQCRIMADFISLRQMFTYRTDTAVIPGYPAIQVDDQVRIFERITGEAHYHYVKGISSSFDLQSGEWTYTLSTHWLGERPFDKWAFDPKDMAEETRQYLTWVGKVNPAGRSPVSPATLPRGPLP